MRQAQTNAELAAFHAEGTGLVFNDFTTGRSGARYNVLHVASCPWVQRMLDRAEPQARPSVRKLLFSAADEAQVWLTSNRGQEGHGWKYCATCGAGRVQTGDRPHPGANTDPAGMGEEDEAGGWVPDALPAPDSWSADALPFAMPASQPLRLPVPPRLASWNKAGDPDQVRLAGYLDVAEELLGPSLEKLNGPLALRLDVGLPWSTALLDQRDLDNYLFPLATRLSRAGIRTLACVWGTKQHSGSSLIRIEQAIPGPPPLFECCRRVHTTVSSQSPSFKEQIREQLSAVSPMAMALPFGPASAV